MIVKKIAIITGKPFGSFLTGSIGLEEKPGRWYGLDKGTLELQFNSINEGYRKATLEEIKSNWDVIKERWDPQPGDVVRITQGMFVNETDYVINEIAKGNPNYWGVSCLDGSPYNVFDKNQMVLSPNHGWEANSTFESVIDKKVEFTIKDGVLRFDGHEVRVGDTVSFNYPSDNKKANDRFIVNQQVLNVETNTYVGSLPFRTNSQWYNIHKVKNFVNQGQPHSKEPFKQPLKFKIYEKVLFITFNKGESGNIVKVDEEAEYFKYYVKLSSNNNVCFCGEKDIIPYSREEERALTIDEHLDSLTKFYSSGLIVEDSEIKLTIPLIKKSVSDYQQKPVTLYKSKTKLSLKPINLTK
jgi:hypothetical protein